MKEKITLSSRENQRVYVRGPAKHPRTTKQLFLPASSYPGEEGKRTVRLSTAPSPWPTALRTDRTEGAENEASGACGGGV
jgi:hypothetical protein